VGVGFFIAYVLQVGLVRLVVGRLVGFTSQPRNLCVFAALLVAAGAMLVVSKYWLLPSLFLGGFLTLCFGGYSMWRLNQLVDLSRFLGRFVKWFK
jgi:hypothetical protein